MTTVVRLMLSAALTLGAALSGAQAAVTTQEAQQLKSTLTPLGAEKAGNKDGTIPAWTGGLTTPTPGFTNGGRRPDPFAAEKPVLSITAATMDRYADKLTDGVKAMLKKYPQSYRLDVYPTHRTAAAPQWVYDNAFANATKATLIDGAAGPRPEGAYGAPPFPIPKSGAEVIWNHILRWRGESWQREFHNTLITADGKRVMTTDAVASEESPYYFKDGADRFNGEYWNIRVQTNGPPIRAGEALAGRNNIDEDKTQSWVYLTGQRRVRKLPLACCDVPTPSTAGSMTFDELEVYSLRIDRFNWKLVGRQEMFIPYNSNRSLVADRDDALLGDRHLNPDHVRWELHRVWVVEATLADGKRHVAPKSRYYVDEDSWQAVLGDRWDGNGQLWKMMWALPVALPDLPATTAVSFGFYDLIAGSWYAAQLMNEKPGQLKIMPRFPANTFTSEALVGESVR